MNPKLRFKDFKDDWTELKVSDAFEAILGGGTPKKNQNYWSGTIPWISSSDVPEDSISRINISRFITEDAISNSATKQIPKGSVLVVSRVGVGKVAIAPVDLCTSQDFTNLIGCKGDPYFYAYSLSALMKRKSSSVQGSAIKGIPAAEIKEYTINSTSLKEQLKISELLSLFDKKITIAETKFRTITTLKEIVAKQTFGQFKYSASRSPLIKLGDVCESIMVGIANSATHAYTETGIPMLRNMNIRRNWLDDTDIIHIKKTFEETYKHKRLKTHDIIVCRTGYPGTACLVPKKYEGAQTFTTLIVRINQTVANPSYICQYINSSFGKAYIDITTIGGGQKNSGASIIRNMPIILPDLNTQQKVAQLLELLDQKARNAKKRIVLLKSIKEGLLQQMFVLPK